MLVAVVGATGNQGASVIAAARESGQIAVRPVVRDPDNPFAADLDDVDSLARAFAGADAAYCVTPADGPDEWGRETQRARNMAAAAQEAKLSHVIWSTQEDTRPLVGRAIPLLGGRYRVPSYDAKADADAAFGVATTFMRTSFYWESLFLPGIRPAGGALRWPLGDARLPGIAVADIGRCAVGVFLRRSEYVGRTIGICGDALSGDEIASAIREVVGIDCRYEPIERGEFAVSDATANMFVYKRECEHAHRGLRDVALSRALNPRLQTFRQWLADDATKRRFLAL